MLPALANKGVGKKRDKRMRHMFRWSISLAIVLSILLAGSISAKTVTQVAAHTNAAASGANADWAVFGGNTDNNRYSPLNVINTSNASQLGLAWTAQEGPNLNTFESVPVVINGVMYYTTSTNQVRAVDAATGKLHWQFTPKVDFYRSVAGGGGGAPVHRGVAVHSGMVYMTTFDARLIALQAATGEKVWETPLADPSMPYSNSSPVVYWNGMIFAGSEAGDSGLRGYVAAYDAKTGKTVWRFYTVPAPGQGWNQPAAGRHGGGDVWMPVVVDTTSGILYAGTGNPSPDFQTASRKGCNQWVNSTIALDARTGKLIWGHSEFCDDAWDYDSHQSPMLFNMIINGKNVRVVEHGNKSSKVFFYEAKTGKIIAQTPYLANWSMPHLAPTANGVKVCPGSAGGIEFSPPSYSPQAELIFQQVLNTCQIFATISSADANTHKLGQVDTGGNVTALGKSTGAIVAISPRTGKVAWRLKTTSPCIGGSLTTAGGLVFAGCDDGHFRALNAKTGQVVWDANLGLGMGAAPMTYAINGTQYVALSVGGSLIAAGDNIPLGGTLAVFKLGGAPVHKLPSVNNGVIVPVRLPSLKGLTQVNPFMYVDAKRQHVVVKLVAAQTPNNNGFNFNGYSKGKATFVIPAHWSIDFLFSNKSALPHSAEVVNGIKGSVVLTPFGFGVMATPNAIGGITSSQPTQLVNMVADRPGKWYLICPVPGHLQSGMWDYFQISATAKMPTIIAK
ncbi:MAG: Pyrrolo-quinoline quinone [Chloroflexi bacterium]|nr:Pyrrolo-quinoline quinone [Chloroflexota bacterium]